METTIILREQPEIRELFQVLEGNGLLKERQEVEVLVDCLEGMENQFEQVLKELKAVREQLSGIQDRGIQAAAVRILGGAENKVQEIGSQFALAKQNIVRSAKNAVEAFKEKGVDALRRAVSAMKIPAALSFLKESLHKGAESMNKNAEKAGAVSAELYKAAQHMKNAGRVLTGREAEDPAELNTDKGILAKVRKAFLSCGSLFSKMEKTAEQAEKRVEQFGRSEAEKPSVMAELKKIKSEKTGGGQAQSVTQDIAR